MNRNSNTNSFLKKKPHLNDLNSFCKEKTSIKMMPTNSKSSIEPNLYA